MNVVNSGITWVCAQCPGYPRDIAVFVYGSTMTLDIL